MHVEKVEQADTKCCQRPSKPDSPTVTPDLGDSDTRDHGDWSDGKGLREEANTGYDRRFSLHSLVVKRQVIQDAPEDYAMDCGFEVACSCSPVLEDVKPD